jgi:hypothetical protein
VFGAVHQFLKREVNLRLRAGKCEDADAVAMLGVFEVPQCEHVVVRIEIGGERSILRHS